MIRKNISGVNLTLCTDWQKRVNKQLDIISISTKDMRFNMKSILGVFLRSTCIGNAAIYHCDKVDENSLIVEEVFFNIPI